VLEGALIFGVLQALAVFTQAWLNAGPADERSATTAFLAGVVFSVLVPAIRLKDRDRVACLRREVLVFTATSIVVSGLAVAVYGLTVGTLHEVPPVLILEGAIAVPLVVAGWRWTTIRLGVLNGYRERILIVGTGENAKNLCRTVASGNMDSYSIVGFAADDRDRLGEVLAMGARVQTDYRDLFDFGRKQADRIVVALDEKRGKLPTEELMKLRMSGIDIEDATSFLERTSGKIAVESMLPSWLIFSDGFKTSAFRLGVKRALDVIHASALLIVTSPLMALFAVLIKLDSPGKILFRQSRVGRNGEEFELFKFRSMREDAERVSGPAWASQNDPRVTRIGRFMRRTRIDELPQLINVLRGEMSFVGPRPERRVFVDKLRREIPYYDLRHSVRPGLTGWAQVEYGYGSTIEENQEKLRYDLYYIKNGNAFLDLWIVLKTVRVVLMGSGAR